MASGLVVEETLHMVPGDGDTSYARNSTVQSDLQNKLKPMIEEAVASLLKDDGATANAYCSGMAIADLGCSSGPNTLVLVSMAIDAVRRHCSELQQEPPELCIHLNDLPSNDFNSVIRSLATYIKTQESSSPPVLASIVPGSFHGRLFNKRSLHLVCSTASFHWLSKAPEDLVRNGIPFYDRDEVVRRARRSIVIKAYARQFNDDFTRILHLRAQEMVPGGRMVFSLLGHRSDDKPESAILLLEFTNAILHEMASKGLIDNEKLDSFYIPIYGPSEKEVREIIEAEGSFSIDKMAVHESLDGIDAPKTAARALRAVMEAIIAQHFGPSADAMDEFLKITEKFIEMAPLDAFSPNKSSAFVAASLTRRT
ncbi:jasmonate O-methyltransferase isoform X1 [Sorghum bicolor]|uniref:Jasmonate O-methyltransferase n=2 Tax=Sorghum bicolor TaxID=4558 RepID=A0A194YH47_SORBI|nr:jasmonate O-methyltransferase isoform X1 [Sorghum bicolor]KXG19297.1 hypothetical protein SORBI_3010G037200 [Sorghum bicolor]|eukprot:XP_021304587.1 jasmonate O-methyltransferase isoform X1 [Sorghum bicolor]